MVRSALSVSWLEPQTFGPILFNPLDDVVMFGLCLGSYFYSVSPGDGLSSICHDQFIYG